MNYYDSLNKVIDNIEENLSEEIDFKQLAKIIGTSSYTLQRIFAFLTGITLTEYIRKRRLSKAAEELLTTDIKIIDLALKYQYDSPISFTNSFKKMHGISPQNLRKTNKSIRTSPTNTIKDCGWVPENLVAYAIKAFPKIEFKPTIETIDELEYRIVNLEKQKLYGITAGTIKNTDNESIKELFDKAEREGILDFIINNSDGKELYYGATTVEYCRDIMYNMKYYILGKVPRKDFCTVEFPKATWACFKLKSKKQEDILKLYNTIYTKWLPTSQYSEILDYPELEIYYENDCEICIPVK